MLKYIFFIGISVLIFASSLSAQDQPEVVVTQGHIDHLSTIAFSPDGRYVATGSSDRSIRLWYRNLLQEYRVLLGHRKRIENVEFSPDGKKLVSIDGHDLIVWEIPSGKVLNTYKVDVSAKDFSFVPGTNNQVLFTLDTDKAIYDIDKGVLVEDFKPHKAMIAWTPHPKKFVFFLCEKPDAISIYDRGGNKQKEFSGEGFYQNITVSPDGDKVAGFSINKHHITVWDYKKEAQIMQIKTNPAQPINKMIFDGTGKHIWAMGWNGEIHVYHVRTGKETMVLNKNKMTPEDIKSGNIKTSLGFDLVLSPDRKVIGVALTIISVDPNNRKGEDLRGVILFDSKTGKELGKLKGYFKWINHLAVGPREQYMTTSNFGKNMGQRVWNLREGELERYIHAYGISGASADGTRLATLEIYDRKPPQLVVYEFPAFKKVAKFKNDGYSAIALNSDGSLLAVQRAEVNTTDYTKTKYFIQVYEVATKKLLHSIEVKQEELPMFWSLKLSPKGDYLFGESSKGLVAWKVATGKKLPIELPECDYEHLLDVHPSLPHIVVSQTTVAYNTALKKLEPYFHLLTIDYTTGELINNFNSKQEGVVLSGDFSPDGQYFVTGQTGYFQEVNFDVIIWDWNNKAEVCRLGGHNGGVKQVVYGPQSKHIYSAAEDGFIKIWNINECKNAASLIGMNQLDYIILSPDNYYKTSKGNNKGIGFRYQDNLYTFDQFDIRFNRPDKVLEQLGVSKYSLRVYTKAWEKRIARLGYTPEMLESDLHLPKVEIINKLNIPIATQNKELELTIKAYDENVKLHQMKVYVNDVPYPDVNGYSLKKQNKTGQEKVVTIPLSKGSNLVKVSVSNKNGLESIRESFEIEYQPKKDKKPNLYLFTVGVSAFQEKERNLKFAQKDGEDLIAQFKQTGLYDKVYVTSFYNENATAANILKAAKFLEKAALDDQVVVYVSTHGLLDDSLNYFLAMHDTDFNNPTSTGLPYEQVDKMLDGISCRNRLVLIDACHSGEVDKSEGVVRSSLAAANVNRRAKSGTTMIRPKAGLRNSFTYMQELFSNLSNNTGATVISAAGGYEFALESDDWSNGVFTYAILQGLKSREADQNNDGEVRISELQWYVTEQVLELTGGQQRPTTRTKNKVNDFVIYRY